MIYKIGNLYLEWSNDNFSIRNDTFMKKFEVHNYSDLSSVIKYKTQYRDLDQFKNYKQLYYSAVSEFYETEKGIMVICHWAKCRFAIGFWMEDLDKDEIIIYINPKMKDEISISANRFFSLVGLHRVLLKRNAAVLHASYVEWNDKAILFTAPSQTGKSTQSQLWKKYENASIINDDRVLIRKYNGRWNAYGYPSCGSSSICINRTLPIETIVVLEQGKENEVIEMSYAEKVKALILGIEVYACNMDEIDMSFELAQAIGKDVKVIKLVCLPNQDAVKVLKNYLRKDDIHE